MGASVARPGTSSGFDVWDNLGALGMDDDAGAHVRIDTSSSTSKASQYLVASGFGFNLPPTASVNGIEVTYRHFTNGSSVYTDQVRAYAGDGRFSNTVTGGGSWAQNRWETDSAGNSRYLWDYPFTVAEVNSPQFGIALAVRSIGPADAIVDSVSVRVHYAYRCDCTYACKSDSECGSDGCGGQCGPAIPSPCGDGGICNYNYCHPLVFVDPASGLMWHNQSFDVANCDSLVYGGYSDWRAPTIDELRSRVVGCPATATGGQCPVTSSCTNAATCLDAGCEGCAYRQGPDPHGCYLDNHTEWTSCTGAGPFFSRTDGGAGPYTLDFSSGRIQLGGGMARYRCVRP